MNKLIKITVLGGSGFLGSALSDYLSSTNKFKIIILDLKRKRNWRKSKVYSRKYIKYKKLEHAIRGSEYVFNFAALADLDMSKDKPFETANINIIGTINSLIVSKNLKLEVYSRKFNLCK